MKVTKKFLGTGTGTSIKMENTRPKTEKISDFWTYIPDFSFI